MQVEIDKSDQSTVRSVLVQLASNALRFDPASLNIQVGRTLIALAQISILLFTSWANLTTDVLGRDPETYCSGIATGSIFCLIPGQRSNSFGAVVVIAICLLVVSGVLPRFTGVLHFWVSFSLYSSLSLPDGGEAVATIATLLILILTLADGRLFAWLPSKTAPPLWARAVGYASWLILCLQMAGLYLQSSLSKLAIADWVNGTAMFYIVRDPSFGASGLLAQVLGAITQAPLGTAALTWGPILMEACIGVLALASRPWRKYGLVLVIVLHLGILVVIGLWSFSLVMIGIMTVVGLPHFLATTAIPETEIAVLLNEPAPETDDDKDVAHV